MRLNRREAELESEMSRRRKLGVKPKIKSRNGACAEAEAGFLFPFFSKCLNLSLLQNPTTHGPFLIIDLLTDLII